MPPLKDHAQFEISNNYNFIFEKGMNYRFSNLLLLKTTED